MKKVLVLFGSPHKKGYTSELLKSFLECFPGNAEVKCFSAFEINPKPCVDCGYCKKYNGCTEHDLDDFMKEFEETDIFIIASPVYNFSFPSPVKSVLDRFQRYYNARFSRNEKPPIKKPKQAVLLMTCGSGEKEGFKISCHQLNRAFTVLNTKLVSSIFLSDTDKYKSNILQDELLSAFKKLDL